MQITKPFWLVWNPQGHRPTYQHASIESANSEAERLARMNTGETFVVLESVRAVAIDNMQRTDLRPDLPF